MIYKNLFFFLLFTIFVNNCLALKKNRTEKYVLGSKKKTANLNIRQITKQFYDNINKIEKKYEPLRLDFQKYLHNHSFNNKLIKDMLDKNGIPERTLTKFYAIRELIPSGMNLGGDDMLILPNSLLFFHRLKLRDNTKIRINSIINDYFNHVIFGNMSLHDLYLRGTYDRVVYDGHNRSNLYHMSNIGEAEIRLSNVRFISEANYRFLSNNQHTYVVMVISTLECDGVRLTYINRTKECDNISPVELEQYNVDQLLQNVKVQLNEWLKNFYNDYLWKVPHSQNINLNDLLSFEFQRSGVTNRYVDDYLMLLTKNMLDSDKLVLPNMNFYCDSGAELKLFAGVLTGTTFYRRSPAVTYRDIFLATRHVAAVIGFSDLKVTYKYIANTNTGYPELKGLIVFSVDDLSAHLHLTSLNNPPFANADPNTFVLHKPVSLYIEGPLNRVSNNYNHVIEKHVTTIILNVVKAIIGGKIISQDQRYELGGDTIQQFIFNFGSNKKIS